MTYNDIMERNILAASLPLEKDGRPLPTALSAKVLLLQVELQSTIARYEELMQEALKKIKPEGFDERHSALMRMEDTDRRLAAHEAWKEGDTDADGNPVERPARPSDEELAQAEAVRPEADGYRAECDKVWERWMAVRSEKAAEDAGTPRLLPRDEYAALVDHIGLSGQTELTRPDGSKERMDNVDYLRLIAANLLD